MRRCTKCGADKPLKDFYSGRPDCKACKRAQSRKNYGARREDYVAYSRQYRIDNYEQTLETARRYRREHLAARREYEANYQAAQYAANSVRCRRINRLIQYFDGRPVMLSKLAHAVDARSDAAQLQWISRDIDALVSTHVYGEV